MRLGDTPKGNSPLLCFRVLPETMERLKAAAKRKRTTVSALARRCVEECIEKRVSRKGD